MHDRHTPEADESDARMAAHSTLWTARRQSQVAECVRLCSDPLRLEGVKGEDKKKRESNAKMKERKYHLQNPKKVRFNRIAMTAVGFEAGEHNGYPCALQPARG